MSDRLRLFVALDLPPAARVALAGWAADAAPVELRPVPEQNLHLTLAFLGSRSRADAQAVAALLPAVAAPVGQLSTAGALWLPARRPAVLAVAIAGTLDLNALHASLAEGLAEALGYLTERRRLRPHVTVARVPRRTRIRATELPEAPALAFDASALGLYRSYTGAAGSRYEPLARAQL